MRVPIRRHARKRVPQSKFRDRAWRRRIDELFGGGDARVGPLIHYKPSAMADRARTLRAFRGPIQGAWGHEQRLAVSGAIHDALRDDLSFIDRERLALAVVRLMPQAPWGVEFNTASKVRQ